jgi:hypothetical protein
MYATSNIDATYRNLQVPAQLYQAINEKANSKHQSPAQYLAALFKQDVEVIHPMNGLLELIKGGDLSYQEELIEVESPYSISNELRISRYYTTPQAKKALSSLDREHILSRFAAGDYGLYTHHSAKPEYEEQYRENIKVLEAREGIVKGNYWVDSLSFSVVGSLTSQMGSTSFAVLSMSSELL